MLIHKKINRTHWLASVALPCCMVLGGWTYVFSESRNLANSAIQAYRARQLEMLHGLANASEVFLTRELGQTQLASRSVMLSKKQLPLNPKAATPKPAASKLAALRSAQLSLAEPLPQVEDLLVKQLIQPLQVHPSSQVWLESIAEAERLDPINQDPTSQSFRYINGRSERRQNPHPELHQVVHQAKEGSLLHVSELTLDQQPSDRDLLNRLLNVNRTASAWTSIQIFPGTARSKTWIIGTSKSLSGILEENGVYSQINTSLNHMTLFTVGILILWGVLLKLRVEQQQYATEVERLSSTDELTGLANRRQLHQAGDLALLHRPSVNSISLISLDLDRFKPINDTLGPEAGDELLVKVAQRLKSCVRQEDLLARLDGDEFAILLKNSSEQDARICAERLLKALHQPFWVQNVAVYINGSLGVATAKPQSMAFSQLMVQADIAMDRSKSSRQGGYTMFDSRMHTEKIARLELERDLRAAIVRDELKVFYQPIVDLTNHLIIGYEALIRWQHHQKGLLQPAEFLPIAAEIGLSLEIERWVLAQACQQMTNWHVLSAFDPDATDLPLASHSSRFRVGTNIPPSISINLSAQHFAQSDLVEYVEHILQQTAWPAHRLTLEITEEAMIQHPDQVAEVLLKLQRLGVRISLDDFGTGYSSLSYLQRFPVDVLKIDKSFIQTVNDRVQDGEIVRTIIALANSLGVGTVAEGIETLEQLNHLKSLRCQYGQGFLFSQPLRSISTEQLIQC